MKTNTPLVTSTIVGSANMTTVKSIYRWQIIARLIMKPVMVVFGRNITSGFDENDLLPEKTYLAVSNHQSHLDAFVLIAGISQRIFSRLQPFRAMTANRFFAHGPIKYAALKMGCYPAKPHPALPSGVEYATALIRRGQTVYICPEGKKSQPGKQTARPGVAILAKLPNVEIIPVHIQWTRSGRWRRSFQLTYGKPFDGSRMSAQQILDHVYALPLY